MTQADVQYNNIIKNILLNGISDLGQDVRPKYADGTPAHTLSVINQRMIFDGTEVPILTTKQVGWKTAIKELLWIWQHKSNSVDELNDMGVHIWDEWKMDDGTIGTSYGYQMGKKSRKLTKKIDGSDALATEKVDQVDYLLWSLKNNPSSRRHLTTLWNIDDLDGMALQPCVWSTHWMVTGDKLNLTVNIRSNDMALGNPFNIFQYYVLQRMIAQVTGYDIGELVFNIDHAHIYDKHLMGLIEQIQRESFGSPYLYVNQEVKNFYDFTIDDFDLIFYDHHPPVSYEVAE